MSAAVRVLEGVWTELPGSGTEIIVTGGLFAGSHAVLMQVRPAQGAQVEPNAHEYMPVGRHGKCEVCGFGRHHTWHPAERS